MKNITFLGNSLALEGKEVIVGQQFKDFSVVSQDLSELKLSNTKGIRIFLTVPSLDTPVCDMEIKKFNKEAADIDNVTIYVVSMDLPFAQERWCGSAGIDKIKVVSDYNKRDFSEKTGTFIKELALITRAAFVVDSNNIVTYVEYLDEITKEPDYKSILDAARLAK